MYQLKIVNAIERLHRSILDLAIRSVEKTEQRNDKKLIKAQERAESLRRAAEEILLHADGVRLSANTKHSKTYFAVNSARNILENKRDDITKTY